MGSRRVNCNDEYFVSDKIAGISKRDERWRKSAFSPCLSAAISGDSIITDADEAFNLFGDHRGQVFLHKIIDIVEARDFLSFKVGCSFSCIPHQCVEIQ